MLRIREALQPLRRAADHARVLSSKSAKSAHGLPLHISEIGSEQLYLLAKLEGLAQVPASRELMRREIMRVDGVPYLETTPVLLELNRVNAEGLVMKKLPYQLTWGAAIMGVRRLLLPGSWKSTSRRETIAKSFNEYFVTTDVPPSSELDTLLEVGSWTWNWMEPPLGTFSFVLLCMQLARDASNNLGAMTPHMRHKKQMADKLVDAFPKYSKDAVADYAMATAFDDDADDIEEDVAAYKKAQAERSAT